MSMDVKVKSNINEVTRALGQQAIVALEACGLAAEGYAKRLCAVDTGLLRNSITYAVDGRGPASGSYSDNSGNQHGSYGGSAPTESGNNHSVYIGTNVEYAPYVEMGTSRIPAQPFIQPAVESHGNEYKRILESYLQR